MTATDIINKTIQTHYYGLALLKIIVRSNVHRFKVLFRFIQILGITFVVGCAMNEQPKQITLPDNNRQKAAQVRLVLGVAYLEQGDLKRALSNLLRAADYTPDDEQVHLALALYEQQIGENDKTEQRYQLALSIKPQSQSVLNHYGRFLCQQKRYTLAHKQFDLALNAANYDMMANSLENKGYCALQEGQYLQAQEFLSRALQHEPTKSKNLLVTITHYLDKRQSEEVATLFDIYQQHASETAESLWLQIRFAKLNEQPKKINDYGQQLAESFPQSVQYKRFLTHEY